MFALAVMTLIYTGIVVKTSVKWKQFWSKATSCEHLREAGINMTKLNNVKRFSVGNFFFVFYIKAIKSKCNYNF